MKNLRVLLLALSLGLTPALAWAAGWLPLVKSSSCVPGTPATNFLARTSSLSQAETDATCFLINDLVTAGAITGTLSGARGCGTVLENFYFLATKNKTTAFLNICG